MSFGLDGINKYYYTKGGKLKMANVLEYASIFQTELDKKVVAGATSGWMESNAGMLVYNGGKTVKLPKMTFDPLGDYDRSTGFARILIDLKNDSYSLEELM